MRPGEYVADTTQNDDEDNTDKELCEPSKIPMSAYFNPVVMPLKDEQNETTSSQTQAQPPREQKCAAPMSTISYYKNKHKVIKNLTREEAESIAAAAALASVLESVENASEKSPAVTAACAAVT